MTGIEALRARHPKVASDVEAPTETVEEASSPAPRFVGTVAPIIEPAPPKAIATANPMAMAKIHGRVLPGSAQNTSEPTVAIADGDREYEAAVDDDGNFQMNLPPGSYTVTARAGDEVAEAEVKDLAEDEDREVTLVLARGAMIEGRVDGCDGPCAEVPITAKTAGTQVQSSLTSSELTGVFKLEGLMPGRKYDLVFQADGSRRLVVRGVAAPKRDLVVTMESLPTLSGGFGIERGEKCPMESISITVGGQQWPRPDESFDRSCRFKIEDLSDAESVHVRATGKGWHFEVDVAIPAHGDPPFLCLHPPCREPEPEVEASLQIIFSGSPTGPVRVWTVSSNGGAETSCDPASEPCILSKLKPAAGVKVHVTPSLCESRNFTVDLQQGTNTLAFHCQQLRRIQGMLRSNGDLTAASGPHVRCSSDRASQAAYDFFFVLECPLRQASIEYQLSPKHPWQAVAIKPGDADSIAFVDIAVD